MSELTPPTSGRGRRTRKRNTKNVAKSPNTRGIESGLYKPLSDDQLQRIGSSGKKYPDICWHVGSTTIGYQNDHGKRRKIG